MIEFNSNENIYREKHEIAKPKKTLDENNEITKKMKKTSNDKLFTKDKENDSPQLKKNFKLKNNLKRREKKINISSKSRENLLLEIEEPSKFPDLIGEGVKGKVIKNKLGISKNDFDKIEQFLENNFEKLKQFKSITHIRKTSENGLTRSLLYMPNGHAKGLYVLLKSKGGVEEVGLGTFYRVTKALNLKTGDIDEMKVFRSGKPINETIGLMEEKINTLLMDRPDLFVVGIPVRYKGGVTSRQRDLNDTWERKSLKSLKEEEGIEGININVEKLSFLMEYIKGSELKTQMIEHSKAIQIGLGIAKGLEVMHEKNIVHFDLKPENIFMTESGVKIGDFGLSSFAGVETLPKGSPLYLAPEVGKVANELAGFGEVKGNIDAKLMAGTPSDIWSLGCILAELVHGKEWINWNFKKTTSDEIPESIIYHGYERLSDVEHNEKGRKEILTNRNDPKHIDFVIDKCLRVNPQERATAKELVQLLTQI